jgi:non-ribosomal peptide synthetase-like protein
VKRDDLTKEKFERCPFITEPVEVHHYDDETANDPTYHRLYHTGDLCRFNTDGCMEYLGRIDLQVKLRGYRIEIEEIESVLQTYPGVDLAIVAKREQNGVEFLCGYVQLAAKAADRPTDQQLSQHLRQKIPAYMVPSRFMFVDEFARTPALKVDRKALPEPTIVAAPSAAAAAAPDTKVSRVPTTATEASVLEVYNTIFTDHARVGIALDSHFFDDLGGTSIMAGRALTELRRRNFNVSVRTLYTNPTIAGLAKHFDTLSATTAASASINIDGGKMEPPQPELPSAFRRPSTKRRVLIGVWQFVIGILAVSNMWLFLIPLQYLVQQLGLDLTMLEYGLPIFIGVLLAAVVVVVQLLYLALILPLLKWLIIQRRQPGRYWIYSWYAVRWWTVRALYDAFPAALYSHMNVVSWMYRATGASIGHGCLLPATFPEADLVTIGNDVYVAPSAQLLTAQVIDQQLILKPIRIGNGASIEACATLEGGSFVPPHCLVRPLTVVTEANELPEGCEWVPPGVSNGVAPSLPTPAAAAASASKRDDETSRLVAPSAGTGGRLFRASFGSRFIAGLLQMAVFILTYTLITAAHFTVVYSMVRDGQVLLASPWYQGGLAVLVAFFGAAISAVWFAVVSAICARLIYPSGCREGTVAVTSPFEFHRWFMFQRVYLMAGTFYPIITTVFGPAWVRAIGLRVGENVQFGLVASLTPGLTDIGSDTFVADFATLNPPTVKGGLMTFRRQTIGDGTMIGNNSVVTCSAVGARCLVGAVTFAPENLPPGKMALGAPFFVSDRTAERPIERPNRTTLVLHALHNLADLVGGQWVSFLSICIGIAASGSAGPAGPFVGLFVFVFVMELLKTALLVFFKWCLNGRLRTANYSLQSPACWRYLSQFALMMSIVPFGILVVLRGSVLFPFVLRMIGMRVGSNCFVDTFQIPETDLAAVGDDSTLNANVTLGTHAAEDGVMKFGRVRIGRRVSIMSGTVIAPACAVGSGCSVAASSSVSKGERLDEMTHWAGMAVSRVPAPPMMNVLLERNTTGQHRVGGKAGYAAVEMRSVGAA